MASGVQNMQLMNQIESNTTYQHYWTSELKWEWVYSQFWTENRFLGKNYVFSLSLEIIPLSAVYLSLSLTLYLHVCMWMDVCDQLLQKEGIYGI